MKITNRKALKKILMKSKVERSVKDNEGMTSVMFGIGDEVRMTAGGLGFYYAIAVTEESRKEDIANALEDICQIIGGKKIDPNKKFSTEDFIKQGNLVPIIVKG